MEIVILVTLIGVLISVSALFSGIETALFSLQPIQIRRLKAGRQKNLAERLERLMENPRRVLSALLLADACANLPLILLCLLLLMRDFSMFGVPFWAGSLGIFAIVVVFCDLVPKMVALRAPFRVAALGANALEWVLPIFDPICRVLQKSSEWLADSLTPRKFAAKQTLDDEELETLIQISAEEGALHVTESEIIQEIIKLGDKTAKDCMTPRIDMVAIADDLTNEEVLPRLRSKRFRRVPVFADTPDNVLGVLDVKRFLLHPEVHYTEQLTPPSYVPETMKALDLLRGFLTHPQRLAIVVDEFGGTEGIVALPDIIEQIISDAVPSSDTGLYIENFGAGRLVVAGSARLDDLGERLNVDLEQDGIDTIGGLIFNRLGYLPRPGEAIEIAGLKITVRRASRKRIQEVLLEVMQTTSGIEGEEAE
jgi:CBS domain containing-hemolysin-like protein